MDLLIGYSENAVLHKIQIEFWSFDPDLNVIVATVRRSTDIKVVATTISPSLSQTTAGQKKINSTPQSANAFPISNLLFSKVI